MKLNFKNFIITVMVMFFTMLVVESLMAQTPANFADCYPQQEATPITYQTARVFAPGTCDITSDGNFFGPTGPTEVFTYQIITKSVFWEQSPKESTVNYIQQYNYDLNMYVTYVHPYMFLKYSEAEIQRRITKDGACDWKVVPMSYNPFPNASVVVNDPNSISPW
jgi:hypothetical protein